MQPAKFVMLVNKDKKYNDGILMEGLNDKYTYFSLGYANNPYTFIDSRYIAYHLKYDDKSAYWIYDVEIPQYERFVSFGLTYDAEKIILSNPRKIYKDDESYDNYIKTGVINDDMYNPEILPILSNCVHFYETGIVSTYIAKKNNNHILISTEYVYE